MANQETQKLDNIIASRRAMLLGGGAAALAAAVMPSAAKAAATVSSYNDFDILNFALNLEYLEAQFYLYAATGKGLASADITAPTGYTGSYTQGTVTATGVTAVPSLSVAQQQIVNEIAAEEQAHVRFLRTALGSAAVPMPSIDLTFFAPLATAAGITTPSSFSPFGSFDAFLIGAFIFEDVGVTAYAGAAPLISSSGVTAGYLNAAAGIMAVEGYHAGYVRTALVNRAATLGATTYIDIANKVEALRAALTIGASASPSATNNTGNNGQASSAATVEVPLTNPTTTSSVSAIVPADSKSAIAFARTVNQVHHIVYGNATVGVGRGGFFPNGTNSIFATTTA